jgi:hypothetical protein
MARLTIFSHVHPAMRNPALANEARPIDARRRRGCLSGCGPGCVGWLLAIGLAGLAFFIALNAVFHPYAFTLGGHFHWYPVWTGYGRVHSNASGGDYLIYVSLEPFAAPKSIVHATNLKGPAWICTPRGETLNEHLYGGMERIYHGPTIGMPIRMSMYNWQLLLGGFQTDRRPELNFNGVWADRAIEVDDRGTISSAFNPDGTVFRGKPGEHRPPSENLKFTIREGSYWEFRQACAANR